MIMSKNFSRHCHILAQIDILDRMEKLDALFHRFQLSLEYEKHEAIENHIVLL